MELEQLKRKYRDLSLVYPQKITAKQAERRFWKFNSIL
jgi:hypothetical protein